MPRDAEPPAAPAVWFRDDSEGFEVRSKGAGELVIAFGGLHLRAGPARFEFLKTLDEQPVDFIAVRDVEQCWYQAGVRGLGDNILDAAQALEEVVRSLDPRTVTMVGASLGGYAALAFGAAGRADKVVAFSPQTFLDRRNRLRERDFRWRTQVAKARRAAGRGNPGLDLRRWFADRPLSATVHYARNHRLDRIHAQRVAGHSGLELVPYDTASHHIVQDLRRSGQLARMLGLAGNAPDPP